MNKRRAIGAVGTGPGLAGAAFWVFGLGTNNEMFCKFWDGTAWHPSQSGWESLGGQFVSPPVVALRGPWSFDIVGLGTDNQMYHKYWDGSAWHPSQTGWEALGGEFVSPPAISGFEAPAPFGPIVLGVGTDNQMQYKYFDGAAWHPSQTGWNSLGGLFVSPPAVAGLDIANLKFNVFGLGANNSMLHRYWDGTSWQPANWEPLGGLFASEPAAAGMTSDIQLDVVGLAPNNQMFHKGYVVSSDSWVPPSTDWEPISANFGVFVSVPAIVESGVTLNRIDVFALGADNSMFHNSKPYFGGAGWAGWAALGGVFNCAPAAAYVSSSQTTGAVHVVCLGTDNQMYHKYFDGSAWHPSMTGWEAIGGTFTVP